MRLRVLGVAVAGLLCSGISVFGQTPYVAPAQPFHFEFAMPEMPPMPMLPALPPMPEMPMFELQGFAPVIAGKVDPEVQFQQEVFRTLLRNSPERALDIAAERLKTDPADPVVIGNLSSIAATNSAKAMPLLVSIAKTSTNTAARRSAVSAVVRNRDDKDALATLQDIYSAVSDNVEVRRATVSAMMRLADPKAISMMAQIAMSDPDSSVRRSAIQFLGSRSEPEAFKALEDILKAGPKTPGF